MGLDIQAETFFQDFNMASATVGQIGHGFIGNAVVELFKPHCRVLVYDKNKTGEGYSTLEEVVRESEVIFVAVPTPMKPSGECHTGIVESVIQDVQNTAARIDRDLGSFILVIKSTVPPGFTKRMQDKYALRITFSPEFLTEANAVRDFQSTNRVIIGGDLEDAKVVANYFMGVWPDRLIETYQGHPDGPVTLLHCESTVAEMVKLSTNVHLTARVMISNELYLICQKLGIDYSTVKSLTQIDRRIGTSHMDVPGPDGNLGYGGHCFVKDTQSLAHIADRLGTSVNDDGELLNLFKKLHQRNLQIRDDRDWEAQKGRAVIDE